MCDTFVVVGDDGVLFAKNSDRDANEAQVLEWVPAASHPEGSTVRCTWIEIPQVPETAAVLLSRPWWMWGAEMGTNAHGVTIGNEAVFTDQPQGPTALLGMDLLRLALERAPTARDAVEVIVDLLERHGQGGSASYEHPGFRYHNSFLVADPTSAFVLETAGARWATEEVHDGARSISNGLTIAGFAEAHADRLRGAVAQCANRRARTQRSASRATSVLDLMAALRDHGPAPTPRWSPLNGAMSAPCVHAGGILTSSQTTASWVAELSADPLHWVTATSAPCTSLFKPVRVHRPTDLGPAPTNRYDETTLWWRHERLHRACLADHGTALARFGPERDRTEADWVADPPTTEAALADAAGLEARWSADVANLGLIDRRPRWLRHHWSGLDRAAAMPEPPLG